MVNYRKLFERALETVDYCTELEKNWKVRTNSNRNDYEGLTPDEKELFVEFIGKVNGLRWQIKKNGIEHLESVLARLN